MPLFDHYIAIDWSAANQPVRGANSIWWASVSRNGAISLENFSTRLETMINLGEQIRRVIRSGERLLIGFDFAFGFPSGLAKTITGVAHWTALWDRIGTWVQDDARNRNNRFEVGSRLNAVIGLEEGPFWGHPHQHMDRYDNLKPKSPPDLPVSFPRKRRVETRQRSAKSVFQLAYTGSVGSQSILGMAALNRLRSDPDIGDAIAIWPFETHFAADLSKPVTVVEIYPSAHSVDRSSHDIIDAAQVLSVARDMAAWDRSGAMPDKLSAFGLTDLERSLVLTEEGWIFGTA